MHNARTKGLILVWKVQVLSLIKLKIEHLKAILLLLRREVDAGCEQHPS